MSTPNRSDLLPDPATVLARDRVIADLRRLVRDVPDEAHAAGDRLRQRIIAYCERLNASKRRHVREELQLLDIAKEMALDRIEGTGRMDAPSGILCGPTTTPDSIMLSGLGPLPRVRSSDGLEHFRLPVWAERVHTAIGRLDYDLKQRLALLTECLQSAHTGQYGEQRAVKTIDLQSVDALTAYVHSLTTPIALPGQVAVPRSPSEHDLRESLDPERVRHPSATAYWALLGFVGDLVRSDPGAIRSATEWWDIAALVLLVSHPDFKPESLGIEDLPPWDQPRDSVEMFNARSDVWTLWGDRFGRNGEERFWLAATRAAEAIAQDRALAESAPDAPIPQPAPIGGPARTHVREMTDDPPELQLLLALSAISTTCLNDHLFRGVAERRSESSARYDALLKASAQESSARANARARAGESPHSVVHDLLDEAYEELRRPRPASGEDIVPLLNLLEEGEAWCDRALGSIRAGAADRLDAALSPGTRQESTRLAERLVDVQNRFGHLRRGLLIPNAVLQADAEAITAIGTWSGEVYKRLSQVFARSPAPPSKSSETGSPEDSKKDLRFEHGADFTWVIWDGVRYQFSKGNQAASVAELWKQWEQSRRVDGCGLADSTIAGAIGAEERHFHLKSVFREHPALGVMIHEIGKGVHALGTTPAINDTRPQPFVKKRKKASRRGKK